MATTGHELVGTATAAERLGVSVTTLHRHVSEGALRPVRFTPRGRRLRVRQLQRGSHRAAEDAIREPRCSAATRAGAGPLAGAEGPRRRPGRHCARVRRRQWRRGESDGRLPSGEGGRVEIRRPVGGAADSSAYVRVNPVPARLQREASAGLARASLARVHPRDLRPFAPGRSPRAGVF